MSKRITSKNLMDDTSYRIGRQNSRILAMNFVPDELKGTEKGFKVWQEYRDKIWKDYLDWNVKFKKSKRE